MFQKLFKIWQSYWQNSRSPFFSETQCSMTSRRQNVKTTQNNSNSYSQVWSTSQAADNCFALYALHEDRPFNKLVVLGCKLNKTNLTCLTQLSITKHFIIMAAFFFNSWSSQPFFFIALVSAVDLTVHKNYLVKLTGQVVIRDANRYPDNLLSGFIWIINYPYTIRIRHLIISNKTSINY